MASEETPSRKRKSMPVECGPPRANDTRGKNGIKTVARRIKQEMSKPEVESEIGDILTNGFKDVLFEMKKSFLINPKAPEALKLQFGIWWLDTALEIQGLIGGGGSTRNKGQASIGLQQAFIRIEDPKSGGNGTTTTITIGAVGAPPAPDNDQ